MTIATHLVVCTLDENFLFALLVAPHELTSPIEVRTLGGRDHGGRCFRPLSAWKRIVFAISNESLAWALKCSRYSP